MPGFCCQRQVAKVNSATKRFVSPANKISLMAWWRTRGVFERLEHMLNYKQTEQQIIQHIIFFLCVLVYGGCCWGILLTWWYSFCCLNVVLHEKKSLRRSWHHHEKKPGFISAVVHLLHFLEYLEPMHDEIHIDKPSVIRITITRNGNNMKQGTFYESCSTC